MKDNSMKKRKGLLALDQLLGVLLSVVAIVMIMYFIAPYLLYTPSNLVIAKSNAESIKNFVDSSSSGEYSRLSGCYNALKLHNLENYQFEDDERDKNNYFYVIDERRVYVLPFKHLGTFMEKKDMQDVAAVYKTDKFENGEVDIFYDNTEQGFSVSAGIEIIPFLYEVSIGRSDKNLDLDINGDYIVLIPFIESDSFFEKVSQKVLDDMYSQNSFYVKVFMNKDYEDIYGKRLIFSPEDRKLFVSGGAISDIIVDNFLCSYLYLNKKDEMDLITEKDEDGNYINLDKIPYTKQKIKIEYVFNDGDVYEKSFLWVGKPVCLENDEIISCDFLGDLSGIDANEFFKIVQKFFLNSDDVYEAGAPKVSFLDVTEDDILKYGIEPKFSDVFLKMEHQGQFTDDEKDKFVFSLAKFFGLNKMYFNGEKESYSNQVAYVNSYAWFYVDGSKDSPNYYMVDKRWFEKKLIDGEVEFYFMKELVDSKDLELNEEGFPWPIVTEEAKFYMLKIPVEGKLYDVILSKVQVSQISVVEK